MTIDELKDTFQCGMHGCGFYKDTNHINSLEAMRYWVAKGVKVIEVDIAETMDAKYVALAHKMDAHCLKQVEINPYLDKSEDKYSEQWFMRQKLCAETTGGLTPMNLDAIIGELSKNPEIIVMFDLWGLWDSDNTNAFSKQLLEVATNEIKERCVLEVYNKKMLEGIREADPMLNIIYCVRGSSADEFDENVSPSILKGLGVDIISYPWVCTKTHPGEIEQYHKEGFTIFSLSKDNRHKKEMQNAGVNVNLVNVIYANRLSAFLFRGFNRVKHVVHRNKRPIMQEMTLEEAHDVAYEMMKEIHEFCVKNGIQYSLAYGSLLGAIRHRGFIPWDDDIDIWMTRPNFEKFTKTFKSKKGYRHSSIYDKDCLIFFDRVYETEHTYVKNMSKACAGKTGIWIDIMPLDIVPDDENLRKKQYQDFASLTKKTDISRGWNTLKENHSYSLMMRFLLYRLKRGELAYIRPKMSYKVQKEKSELIRGTSNSPSTSYCFFNCGVLYRKEPQEILPAKSFDEYELAKFEDTEFMIIKDYDTVLKILFGDYMTPPPVGKRQKSHGICYWR